LSDNVTYNTEPTTSSPGAILKRCREYHGISLDEAAEATKVGTNYLKALEEDQITEFASLAYLKGFLRIYAAYLGLNPDDIMKFYEKLYNPSVARNDGRPGVEGQSEPVRRRFPWQKFALPLFLLLLLIITAAIHNRSTQSPQQQSYSKPVESVRPAATAIQPARSSASQVSEVQKAKIKISPDDSLKDEATPSERNVAQKQLSDTDRGFIVRMKVTQNGTLAVTIDGATAQNYDLTAGDVIEWKAGNSISLDLSNAGGVEATLNGKPLKPFGPAGKPAYIVLDADGIKQ
jgi:cytoskeleton protein RodZ